PLERRRDGAAAAQAERRQAVAALTPVQLVEQRLHDPRAARPDRMAQGDRAAVDVRLVPVEAQLAAIGERLGRERLVDLDEVERLDREPAPRQAGADAPT